MPRFFKTARQYQKPGTLEWQLFGMDFDPADYASQDSWNEHWYERCWELMDKYDPDMFICASAGRTRITSGSTPSIPPMSGSP